MTMTALDPQMHQQLGMQTYCTKEIHIRWIQKKVFS